jgi:hypothetical protein
VIGDSATRCDARLSLETEEVKEGEEVEEMADRLAMAVQLLEADRRGATLRLPALREGPSPNLGLSFIVPAPPKARRTETFKHIGQTDRGWGKVQKRASTGPVLPEFRWKR